jgi:hypothetical protein
VGLRARSRFFAARGKKFAGEGFEEAAAPDGDEKSGGEEQDGVEAGAALASPVNAFLEVEPEGELVECESGADAVEQGHQAAGEERGGLGSCADLDEPAEADNEEEENPPNEVVDMGAANVNVMERSNVTGGSISSRTGYGQGKEESDSSQKEASPGAIANMLMKQLTDMRMMKKQKD